MSSANGDDTSFFPIRRVFAVFPCLTAQVHTSSKMLDRMDKSKHPCPVFYLSP